MHSSSQSDTPVWAHGARPTSRCAPLATICDADVVVIGAGISGLCCALQLARMALSVVVLEAGQPGDGASGRNAGQWLPGWAGPTPMQIEQRFGPGPGRALNAFNLAASQQLPAHLRALGIDADLRHSGIVVVAHNARKFAELAAIHAYWSELGAGTTLLRREEVRGYVDSARFCGGLLYHDAGTLNPLDYTRGLAHAAQSMGVVIHGDTPVRAMQRQRGGWRVLAAAGSVNSARVALCTDAFITGLWPALDTCFYRLPLAMIASEVLGDRGRSFMPAGIPFADTNAASLFGGMLDRDGRFVASVLPLHRDACALRTLARNFDRKFARVFPHAQAPVWRQQWHGHVGMVPGAMPRILRLDQNVLAVLGYSGAGLALGTALGRELACHLAGSGETTFPLAPVAPRPLGLARLAPVLFRHVLAPIARASDRFY